LRQAERELNKVEGEEGKREAEKRVYEAKLDLNYIMHYPPGEKYISLFKDAGVMRGKREEVRREVERRMKRDGLGESKMDFDDEGEDKEEGGVELGSSGEGKAEGRDKGVEKRDKKKGKSKKKVLVEEKRLEEQDDFFEF